VRSNPLHFSHGHGGGDASESLGNLNPLWKIYRCVWFLFRRILFYSKLVPAVFRAGFRDTSSEFALFTQRRRSNCFRSFDKYVTTARRQLLILVGIEPGLEQPGSSE
jgi:hypothetical protein